MIRQNFSQIARKIFPNNIVRLLLLLALLLALGNYGSYLVTQPVLSKGTFAEIGPWAETTALPVALAGRNTVIHGNRLYVIGGKKADNTANTDIYSAVIDSTGAVGAWEDVGDLPKNYYLFTSVVAGDALFLLGGWDGANTVNDVWRAPFLADGRLDNWGAMPALPVAIDLHDTVLIDGHIYVVGGWNGTAPQQAIYAAPVTGTGLGGWQLVGNLPNALYRHAVAGAQGHLYVTGGYNAGGAAQTTVLAARVNGTAALGGWLLPPALPMPTYYHNVVVHENHLVALGGRTDSVIYDSVYSAPIGSDGLPGTWQVESSLPSPLHRFGAAVTVQNGVEYLLIAAGLQSDVDYLARVYHSTVPQPPTATPTPTLTPTLTPTPTPTGSLTLSLSNSPQYWVGPGDRVTYTIRYSNNSETAVENVLVANTIPAGVQLVEGSVQASTGTFTVGGTEPGSVINWQVGEVAPAAAGEVAYTVERPLPPTPVIPLALGITIDAPAEADTNDEIRYEFEVINRAPIALNNLVVTNTLPAGARYIDGDEPPVDGVVRWTIERLDAETATELHYTVLAQRSLVNFDYRVTSQEGASTRGRDMAVTIIDNQPPQTGDGFIVRNDGASATWGVGGQSSNTGGTYNPSFAIYLPTIQGGE